MNRVLRGTQIANLKVDEDITEFFLVKSIAIKLGSNKKQYLDLLVADSTGEITAKKWDLADEELASLNKIEPRDIVKIKATVTQWNGLKQLRIARIRKGVKEDKLDKRDFVKAAPEPSEDMYEYIHDRASAIKDADFRAMCLWFLSENREKLMYYPAAQRNHHAQMGGLLYHTKRMLMNGDKICETYTELDRDLVAAGVIMHDMQKINEIESDDMGISTGYFKKGILLGHIVQGINAVETYTEGFGMDKEKALLIQHMILSHHYEPEFGSPKRPMFPEAEILHYLDVIDARMFDMFDALQGVEEGEFSEKIRTLENRRVYQWHRSKQKFVK